jgi:ribosomal protein L37AE/L43A
MPDTGASRKRQIRGSRVREGFDDAASHQLGACDQKWRSKLKARGLWSCSSCIGRDDGSATWRGGSSVILFARKACRRLCLAANRKRGSDPLSHSQQTEIVNYADIESAFTP